MKRIKAIHNTKKQRACPKSPSYRHSERSRRILATEYQNVSTTLNMTNLDFLDFWDNLLKIIKEFQIQKTTKAISLN